MLCYYRGIYEVIKVGRKIIHCRTDFWPILNGRAWRVWARITCIRIDETRSNSPFSVNAADQRTCTDNVVVVVDAPPPVEAETVEVEVMETGEEAIARWIKDSTADRDHKWALTTTAAASASAGRALFFVIDRGIRAWSIGQACLRYGIHERHPTDRASVESREWGGQRAAG